MRFLYALLLISFTSFAQKGIQVTYNNYSNGKITNDDVILFLGNQQQGLITKKVIFDKKQQSFPKEKKFINYNNKIVTSQAEIRDNNFIITNDSTSIKNAKFELTNETKEILGYKCKKAKTTINSNSIEIWYTNDVPFKGGPSILGQDLGLVLEINRNNTFSTKAKEIIKIAKLDNKELSANSKASYADALAYQDFIWKSKFTTLPIFSNEIISFNDNNKSNDSILKFGNGTVIIRKIKFPKIGKTDQVFVDLEEKSNGDAYDRTGSVFIIPTSKEQSFFTGLTKGINTLPIYENGNGKKYQGVVQTKNYLPTVELMRFFTPFGVGHFNGLQLKDKTWQESVFYRQDISELYQQLSGKDIYVGVFIGNYDKGGHEVSLNITIHKDEKQFFNFNYSEPLFNTTNLLEIGGQEYGSLFDSEKGLEVTFTLDKEVKNAMLRYITTGHGGWENGDEFVPKTNTILLDDAVVHSFIPWKQDCGSYREYNPVSGNFDNGLSSSDYSRANWCPGTVTNPNMIALGDLKPGTHKITIKIPQGKPEGGSFSFWNVSGVLLGNTGF